MKRLKPLSNSLKKVKSDFECGGCNDFFDSAYLLHDHMRDHVEGGSYYYNNITKTAFPVSAKTDASTQVCSSDLADTRADKYADFVTNVTCEESSDTDTYDDFDRLQSKVDEHYEKEEPGISSLANVTKDRHKANKRMLLTDTAEPKSKNRSANKFTKSVFPTKRRTSKRFAPFKQSKTNINSPDNEMAKSLLKQSLLPVKDVRISLTRIDRVIPTNKTRSEEVTKIKIERKNDTGSIEKYGQEAVELKKNKTTQKKVERNLIRETNKNSEYTGMIEEKYDKSDPDYEPDEEAPESSVPFDVDDTDFDEEDYDDPDWKKAKLECRNMECENCNKYVDEAFTKANLLALHNIPFRQENGQIIIKSKLSHKDNKGYMRYLKSESGSWEYLSWRKNKLIHKQERSRAIEKTECKECGKRIKSDYLHTHMVKYHNYERHSRGRPKLDACFKCETCNKFVKRKNKKKHESTHMCPKTLKSEPEEMDAVCEICGRMCLNARTLLTHMKVHSIKNLTCKHCGHVATSIEEREKHKKKHKNYQYCETCGARCVEKKGLYAHIRKVHLKIRNSVCDVCGRGFYSRFNMETHRAIHFAPSLECGYCGKKFNDPSGLRKHKMTHTGEVRYTCQICNHGFIQSTPYWTHMQKRHSVSREEAMTLHRKKVADENELNVKLENNWTENLDSIVIQNSK